jgi:hypothetical protein
VPGPYIPTPLDQLGQRPFSFYPPIAGIQHNEWRLRRSGLHEIEVMNSKTGEEISIARRFVGGVSSIEEPVMIVGLTKELEYKEGMVVPLVRRVIEMPQAVNDIPWRSAPASPGHRAPVVGIRLASEPELRKGRTWMARIAAGVLTCVVGLIVFRDGPLGYRARFFAPAPRLALPFTASDDYISVVSRLGRPSWDRTFPAPDGKEFYLLRYAGHGYTVVLLGRAREDAHYAGALGRGARVVHSVTLPDGRDSTSILAALRRP